MQCARPPHTRERRGVTVLSKKKKTKKKDEKKKSLRRFRRHRPSFRFSLGTVKNENVLYYFLHVRVLQDSNLLNFTVLLFHFSDISSGKFERVVSRRRELEVVVASKLSCERQLSHVEHERVSERAGEQTALPLLVGHLIKCVELFRKRPSGQKDTLPFCHAGLKIRCRCVSVMVCAKNKTMTLVHTIAFCEESSFQGHLLGCRCRIEAARSASRESLASVPRATSV